MVQLDIWINQQTIGQHERKSCKRGGKFCPHHSPYSNYFYLNKPKIVKKCKKGVNMIHHVNTITCKQNEKMYIGQSLKPKKWFKQHALNPPTKMNDCWCTLL